MNRSPNIVRVVKSRRLRWAGHVARMKEGRSAFKIRTGKPTERSLWGGLGLDGRTILECTLNAGNWVDSVQDRNYWRALVKATLNLRVP